jgi:outer membrane protein assembly factor BamB
MSTGWKYSESPLIDGEKVICTPGSQKAMLAALDRKTGKTVWTCAVPDLGRRGRSGAAYASTVISEACGVRQYVQLVGKGLIGVRAVDGKLLWHYNRIANGTANIPTPVTRGDYVFCTTSYGTGAVLLKLVKSGGGVEAKEVYFLGPRTFENIHGGVVLVGDYIYSAKGHKYNHEPICIEFLTGKVVWKAPKALGRKSAATLYADGHLYYRYENGTMALVEATPEAYRLKSTWEPKSKGRGPTWPHPVIWDRKLFLRHADELACYDLAAR